MRERIEFLKHYLEEDLLKEVLETAILKIKEYEKDGKSIFDAGKILTVTYGLLSGYKSIIEEYKEAKFYGALTILFDGVWTMSMTSEWTYKDVLEFLKGVLNEQKEKERVAEEVVNE
jgi:hypothetical protein